MKNLNLSTYTSIAKSIGGKAKNLSKLYELGFNVPQWMVIPQEIFMSQLPVEGKYEWLLHNDNNLRVPKQIFQEIKNNFGPDYQNIKYAVRSSAIEEDGKTVSFAGQFESYLEVDFLGIEAKIIEIWKSSYSKRVLSYRKTNKLTLELGIAVIIQEMVPAEISGVGFGINPMTGKKNSKIISSVWGLGEGLVSGALNADNFLINDQHIQSEIQNKKEAFLPSILSNGIEKIVLSSKKSNQASLNQNQVEEICTVLDQLELAYGQPQDIEFAYAKNRLYLLQARPITAVKTIEQEGQYVVWDNSNIIESYPGITTPLTFSFIAKMYERVYRQLSSLMGVSNSDLEKNKRYYENTLGLVRGRVYYNLLSWYKMLSLVPGYSINAEFMENMMGVKEKFELEDHSPLNKNQAWFKSIKMVINMIKLQFKLPKERIHFKRFLDEIIDKYLQEDYKNQSSVEIVSAYRRFEDTVLKQWKAPMINDFFSMIWFGTLQKQCIKYFGRDSNLHNDLLCGSEDIISVQPIHKTIAIAKKINEDSLAKQLFLSQDPAVIWQRLEEGNYPAIKKSINLYLIEFGERCIGELKLESISYAQNPPAFIKILKAYLKNEIFSTRENNIDLVLREEAEKKAKAFFKLKPLKRIIFQWILRLTRSHVSSRENLRYERTRAFGIVRKMMTALGDRLYNKGQLSEIKDIFYLKIEEIESLKNDELSIDLKSKIKERKSRFGTYHRQKPPQPRFFTYGNNFLDEYIYSEEKLENIKEELKGIGCCPGKIRAKARVILDPNEIESLNGDILITSSTDPGWVTLFPTASAILVERGSLLSHSAIVSREMGIPCIVAIDGLLRSVKTGDEVTLDGSTGTIKIHKS